MCLAASFCASLPKPSSIEHTGQRSLYRRDPVLHHFVRGLLLARSQRPDAALEELRAAMDSPTYGFTRINLELGRLLLAMHLHPVATVRHSLGRQANAPRAGRLS